MKRRHLNDERQIRTVDRSLRRRVTISVSQREQKNSDQDSCSRHLLQLRAAALSIVIANGFLFRFDCMSLACTDRDSYNLWQGIKLSNFIPNYANAVEVQFNGAIPNWKQGKKLDITKKLLVSQAFLANVYYTLYDLRAKSRRTKRERTEAQVRCPKWGEDIQFVEVVVWDVNKLNDGGIHIAFGSKNRFRLQGDPFQCPRIKFENVRLFPDLTLWTGLSKRAVKLYDGSPLLPK